MAGTRFQVKTYGADLVARHLDGVARRGYNIAPAAPKAAVRVSAGYARAFDRQGPGWKPLKPSTIRSRIREGYSPGPILDRTGQYRRAASNPFNLHVMATHDAMLFSVNDKKAGYHQDSRPLRLSFGDRMALIKELSNYIIEGYYD